MRYTVNYSGAFFTGDSDGWNCYETNSWEKARELFYTLYYAGLTDTYIKDEEYQCTFQYDERDKDFVWEG